VPPPPAPESQAKQSRWTVRRVVLGVILLYLLLLVFANRGQVAVDFLFFKTEASLFVVLLLAIALGFVTGWLFDDLRARRRRGRTDA